MPPSKGSANKVATAARFVGDNHDPSDRRQRTNSRLLPIEAHFHLPQETKKQSSFTWLNVNSMKNSLKKFRRSKALRTIYEGPHNPKDEHMVESFRQLLLAEGQLHEKHDDYHTLLRFLRMRGFDIQKSKEMYLKMLTWRRDSHVDTIEKDFTFEEYEEVKKCYPHGFHGVDRYGRPLYIQRLGLVDLDALLKVTTIERFVKYHIMDQEKTLNLRYPACSVAVKRHIASTIAILDVKGVGRNNFSKPARDLFVEIQKIDSNYYPETLHQLFIINAGSGFRVLWQAVKAFLEPRTVAKIHVLGTQYWSKLVESIDQSNLPTFLGGSCTCSEFGGCLLKDKGPWNIPVVMEVLRVFLEREQNSSSETTSTNFEEALEDFDREDKVENEATSMLFSERKTWEEENGLLRQHAQTDYITNILPQKILELEGGLKGIQTILERILLKEEEIEKQIKQLMG